MIDVLTFDGKFRFLSNFFPVQVEGPGGIKFSSVEHAYQASKTLDPVEWEEIFWASSPAKAKAIGRNVKIRWEWEQIKLSVMEDLVRQKFCNQKLYNELLKIDGMIVEGNWWGDKFWGVDIKTNVGQNHLGKILMKIRDEGL